MKQILKVQVEETELELAQDFLVFSEIDLQPGNIIRIGGCHHKILNITEFNTIAEIVDFMKCKRHETSQPVYTTNYDWGALRTARVVKHEEDDNQEKDTLRDAEEEIENTIGYVDVLEVEII